MALGAGGVGRWGAMKNIKRWAFGLISSLFLAVGLVRAADALDTVTRELTASDQGALSAAPDCTQYCDIADDLK
jgi:hypothetical protein